MSDQINPEIARLFRARLQDGETLLWQSQPDPWAAARSGAFSGGAGVVMVLLGMFWLRILLSVAIYHPARLLNPSYWSPFVLITAVLAWGAWSGYRSALRTGYAVTNRRILLILSGQEPIFSGREREASGYVKLSVAASGLGAVALAASATASGTGYSDLSDAASLFIFVAGDLGGPVLTGQNLLPPSFGPAQILLAPSERVLWQSEADRGLMARAFTQNGVVTLALIEVIAALFTFEFLSLSYGSTLPPIYLLCLPALLALGTASWFSVRRWAAREADRDAPNRFYALTDRRLVIAQRTRQMEIIQLALDRLEVRENVPDQHKIRLRKARGGDIEMLYLADTNEAYALLTEAVAQAKREKSGVPSPAMTPEANLEPNLPGEDTFHKQLRQGEEVLWHGDSRGGGWWEATRALRLYGAGIFSRAALFIVAFPLVMGADNVGWGTAGACLAFATLVILSIVTTAWNSIGNQEYAITGERLLIARKTGQQKRRLVQADLREPVNITLLVDPKTGRGEFGIACREADATFVEVGSHERRLALSLFGVSAPRHVYNLLTAASLARPVPQSVWVGEANSSDPFGPFLRPDEAVRWQGSPKENLAGGKTRWDSDRFLPPAWILVWIGLLTGAGHIAGFGWLVSAMHTLPFAVFALAARYEPKRRPVSGINYALTSQRLLSLDRSNGFTLADLDLSRVERIITQQKRGDVATFVFLVGENRVRWTDIGDADAVYRLVDAAVSKARIRVGHFGTPE